MEGHRTEGARTSGGVAALSLVRIRPYTVLLLVGIDIGAGVRKIMRPSNQSTVYPQISTNEIAPLLLEVLIVVLTMSEEATQARLKERHQDSQREVSWLQVEKYFHFLFLKYFSVHWTGVWTGGGGGGESAGAGGRSREDEGGDTADCDG